MYSFSFSALAWGILVMAISAVFIRFHRPLANTFGGGVSSYDKYKIWGLIGVGVGILMMFNLPAFLINTVLNLFFGN